VGIVTIPKRPQNLQWDYDEDTDVLYLSIGEPQPAIGIDIGKGLVLRYDEVEQNVVGLTIFGLRARLLKELGTRD
jgi:uncharacterized protein YuzE